MGLISRVSSRTYRYQSMAYHSDLKEDRSFGTCNMAWLPLKNTAQTRGNAPEIRDQNEKDIIDDILYYFKPNVFFATYDIKSDVDRTFVYGTLYMAECLKALSRCQNADAARKQMYSMAVSSFDLPGDPGFPLNGYYKTPRGGDGQNLRTYLTQLRQELGHRLVPLVYDGSNGDGPSKWWLCFNKQKFMNKALVAPGA